MSSNDVKVYADYAKEVAKWCFEEGGENLKLFNKTLARFSDYSTNNILLIMGYRPDATMIKSVDKWIEAGVTEFAENTRYIPIIEPAGGTYEMKYLVDVSDTNFMAQEAEKISSIDALEALLSGHVKDIKVVDEIKPGVRAMFDIDNKVIMVKRSNTATPEEFFCAISSELVHMHRASGVDKGYKRAINQLYSMAAAHALAERYEIETDIFSFGNLPARYHELDGKAAHKELDKIRDEYLILQSHMSEQLTRGKEKDTLERT